MTYNTLRILVICIFTLPANIDNRLFVMADLQIKNKLKKKKQ